MADEKSKEIRAHGMTHGELEKVRQEQIQGTVEMVPANNSDSFQDKYFEQDYKGYQIPYHETMHYHIALESRSFDPQSGERLSRPSVQVMDTATFDMMMSVKPHGGFYGRLTHILHNPKLQAAKKSESVAPTIDFDKYRNGEPLPVFESLKDVKDFYEGLTGKKAAKSWSESKTIDEIQKELGI